MVQGKVSWIDQPRNLLYSGVPVEYKVEHEIDEFHTYIDHVDGLKTNLFPYQKRSLKAMVDMEQKKNLKIAIQGDEGRIKFNAGVLSEPVGSGKTIIALALIVYQKSPAKIRDIVPWNYFSPYQYSDMYSLYMTSNFMYKEYKNILSPTLIFVGLSVLDQWVKAIKKFTNLKCFVVNNIHSLKTFIKKIYSSQINDYDVVVVKNGKVSKMIKLPPELLVEPKNIRKTTVHIYNIITNLRNYCWTRVINDDVDTNGLPGNASTINALFTWYVSSTKRTHRKFNTLISPYKTVEDSLLYSDYTYDKLYLNPILMYNLNVRSSSAFIESSNNLSSPVFYAYKFKNPNDKYISLLGSIGEEKALQITEMLNSDAVESAAEIAGIKSTSAADIFQKMLGNQYNKYTTSSKLLKFIEEVRSCHKKDMSLNPDPEEKYGKKDLTAFKIPEYRYNNLSSLLSSSEIEYKEKLHTSGLALQRVKDNIETGKCPICDLEFCDACVEDEDIVILKCCSLIVCSGCCFNGIFKNKRSLSGVCSNCRAKVDLMSLIYISNNFSLDKIVEYEPEEKKEVVEKDVGEQTKMDALVCIIRGEVPRNEKKVEIIIHNLMSGKKKLPPKKVKKVLVFSNFNETLKNIASHLDKEKIKFWKLNGSNNQISKITEEFSESKVSCALLINSVTHCAGRNFQMCTDLVFMHVIHDKNIESQVAGRGQRLGRTSTLNIRYMLYDNEYNDLVKSNQMRII